MRQAKSFETFQPLDSLQIDRLITKEPWAFNSRIGIRKYRITIEEIEEPAAILQQRVRKLWSECENHHLWVPLKAEAEKLGIELRFEDIKKRKSGSL